MVYISQHNSSILSIRAWITNIVNASPPLPRQSEDIWTLQIDQSTPNWHGVRVLRAFLSSGTGWGPVVRVALLDRRCSFIRVRIRLPTAVRTAAFEGATIDGRHRSVHCRQVVNT